MTKTFLRIAIVLGIPLLVGVFAYLSLSTFFLEAADPTATDKKILIEVEPGSSFRSFTKKLQDKGIIKHWLVLDLLSQLSKDDKNIKAGEYILTPAMKPREIINKLASGDVFKRIVTIKEGMDMWQIAAALEEAEVVSANDFLKAVQDPDLLSRMEITAPTAEGYLFPETYYFSGKPSPISVIWTFVDQFNKQWDKAYNERLKELNFSVSDVLTLASIIEKESGNSAEQPIVSSVFHNRLRRGMKLDSDPTLVYGLKNFSGIVTNKDKERASPYNTYQNFGLPPGPIANPGNTAIKAALYPDTTDFTFFVADGNGGHVFSENITQHNIAVRKYRNLMRERNKQEQADAED